MQDTKDKLVYTVTICVTLTLCFSVLAMVISFMLGLGKGSGQRRDFQNDFTSIQYPNWRDDWIPEWYQTEPKRRR